jgi:hypothetical protein
MIISLPIPDVKWTAKVVPCGRYLQIQLFPDLAKVGGTLADADRYR